MPVVQHVSVSININSRIIQLPSTTTTKVLKLLPMSMLTSCQVSTLIVYNPPSNIPKLIIIIQK